MSRGKYRRLSQPQSVTHNDVRIDFNEWHCFEFITTKQGPQFTHALVKDHLGRLVEFRLCDLGIWSTVFMLEKDFGSLYVGETVDIIDPSTSDGETIMVSDKGKEVRVPVAILTPVERHAWKVPMAV